MQILTRTAIRDYDFEVLGVELGFEGLMTGATVPLTSERPVDGHCEDRRAEQRIAQRLCDMGVPMVAVPKTIDNDLCTPNNATILPRITTRS